MISKKFCKLTLPFSPYIRKGEPEPFESKRIRPKDALDLALLVREMRMSAVADFTFSGQPWSVVSVFSPYTPNAHVMLMESSPDRYLPGPEWIPEEEGGQVMQQVARIMDFLAKQPENDTLHAGYNWAPRSWGEEEEKTGFQSIPTKWHPMLWGWPKLEIPEPETPERKTSKPVIPEPETPERKTSMPEIPEPESSKPVAPEWENAVPDVPGCVEWVDADALSLVERRLFGDNDYSRPLCRLISDRLQQAFEGHALFHRLFDLAHATPDSHTLVIPFFKKLPALFRTPGFFQEVMKPVAMLLETLFRDLTETLTDLDCGARDRLLQSCVTEGRALWETLRRPPKMRGEAEIYARARQRSLPEELVRVLIPPVEQRCRGGGDPRFMWRVGFGYSLGFSARKAADQGELRILPGVYLGPGGIVETQGVILRRPEFVPDSRDALAKSRLLWELEAFLGA